MIHNIDQLLEYLQLDKKQLRAAGVDYSSLADGDFPLRCSKAYLQRIKKSDPKDPLLLQILPQAQECEKFDGFVSDPLKEQDFLLAPGLLQKYRHRLLLMLTPACGIHCRYCFRRHFPYQDNPLSSSQLADNVRLIGQRDDIHEVILSGGDPLVLGDKKLLPLLQKLAAIKHLKRLRIHSRQLVVEPQRLTAALEQTLKILVTQVQLIFVSHINHAREIDEHLLLTMQRLRRLGVVLLNQSVLLKGVNDSCQTLMDLSERLLASGIVPYYLHYLDPVAGSQHFQVPLKQALEIYEQLQCSLPGYLVPRLVREQAYDHYKQTLFPTSE